MSTCHLFVFVSFVFGLSVAQTSGKVIYAVNAGGGEHVDSSGITYLADTLNVGVESDYGRRQPIGRAPSQDGILYQTERWHDDTFSYDVPIKEEGDYVLVLKFAEVYFYGPNLKVFDVRLNNQHVILPNLDIFSHVGHSTAHDETVPFSIKKGKLSVLGQYSTFNGMLKVEFVKGLADNPKVCAFYLLKGTLADVPKLPDLPAAPEKDDVADEEDEDEDEDDEEPREETPKTSSTSSSSKSKVASGPPAADPYAEDSSSLIMPIMVAFAIFIPTLACLCRF